MPALIIASLVAISFADVVVGARGLWASDIVAYQYPLKQIFASVVWEGAFPSWNPYSSGGQPLAANPAFQAFYPPNWLVLLPPFSYWFQLHIILHVIVAGLGMYVFVRSLGLSRTVALIGAVSFALGAPYLSLLVRLAILFSLAWLPWLLASVRWLIEERSARAFAATSAVLALQVLLGEPTVFVQSVGLALTLAIMLSRSGEILKSLLILGGSVIASVLLAAIQLIPAIDHARDSVRADGFTFQISSNWSMPFSRLLEVVYPEVFRLFPGEAGQHALSGMYPFRIDAYISEIYLGIFPSILLLSGLLTWKRAARWSLVVALPFVVMALGSHVPLWRFLFDTGLARSIRYPEKFILGALFVLLVGALFILQQLLDGDRALRRTALAMTVAWLLVGALISFGNPSPDTAVPSEVRPLSGSTYGMFVVLRGAALIGLLLTVPQHATRQWLGAALLFVALDAAFVHTRTAARMPRSFFEPPPLASELAAERDSYRIFHQAYWDDWLGDPAADLHFAPGENAWLLRNGMFGYRSAVSGFKSVFDDDIDQTGLRNSEELRAAVIEARQKSGVWPAPVMHSAGVRYAIEFRPEASREDSPDRWLPVFASDLGPVDRHFFASRMRPPLAGRSLADAMARGDIAARTAYADAVVPSPGIGRVLQVKETSNRIELDVTVEGRGFLVVAMTGHKYWSATIDGDKATLYAANTAFQGLIVPDGRHQVVMKYRNPLIPLSAAVSGLTLLLLVGGMVIEARRRRALIETGTE